jgi:hypothetical protein
MYSYNMPGSKIYASQSNWFSASWTPQGEAEWPGQSVPGGRRKVWPACLRRCATWEGQDDRKANFLTLIVDWWVKEVGLSSRPSRSQLREKGRGEREGGKQHKGNRDGDQTLMLRQATEPGGRDLYESGGSHEGGEGG